MIKSKLRIIIPVIAAIILIVVVTVLFIKTDVDTSTLVAEPLIAEDPYAGLNAEISSDNNGIVTLKFSEDKSLYVKYSTDYSAYGIYEDLHENPIKIIYDIEYPGEYEEVRALHRYLLDYQDSLNPEQEETTTSANIELVPDAEGNFNVVVE